MQQAASKFQIMGKKKKRCYCCCNINSTGAEWTLGRRLPLSSQFACVKCKELIQAPVTERSANRQSTPAGRMPGFAASHLYRILPAVIDGNSLRQISPFL
ncbi:hypothetical protein chiPu_0006012 [Chiloscyllium punctatum]|uniref:Uncharacterized protein n=1 Tax=Chiloscyllium punctatum TaxID=137246 RepID=A0A401SB12_CHIPU|nr:hypothetical protein [Chiloscyllium punctatum]